jgi:AcrR family transcriptional regulator
MPRQKPDRRQQRTRDALLLAFRDLILQRRFDEIATAEVAARAHVSRSTLYEHFAGKDGLLAASIAVPFARLAATLGDVDNSRELQALLEHFWSNRALARVLFFGAARRKTLAVLTDQIERNLRSSEYGRGGGLILPVRLAAVQLAEILLAPVAAWLAQESRCSAAALAHGLRQVGRAALASLRSR